MDATARVWTTLLFPSRFLLLLLRSNNPLLIQCKFLSRGSQDILLHNLIMIYKSIIIQKIQLLKFHLHFLRVTFQLLHLVFDCFKGRRQLVVSEGRLLRRNPITLSTERIEDVYSNWPLVRQSFILSVSQTVKAIPLKPWVKLLWLSLHGERC